MQSKGESVTTLLLNEWQSFYLVMFRLKSAPQTNRQFLLSPRYQTPVNKLESSNVRSKETSSIDEVILN